MPLYTLYLQAVSFCVFLKICFEINRFLFNFKSTNFLSAWIWWIVIYPNLFFTTCTSLGISAKKTCNSKYQRLFVKEIQHEKRSKNRIIMFINPRYRAVRAVLTNNWNLDTIGSYLARMFSQTLVCIGNTVFRSTNTHFFIRNYIPISRECITY